MKHQAGQDVVEADGLEAPLPLYRQRVQVPGLLPLQERRQKLLLPLRALQDLLTGQ